MSQRSCRDGATMGKVLLEEALGGRARRREKSIKLREREQRSHPPRGKTRRIYPSRRQINASSDAPYGSDECGIRKVYGFVMDM